MQPLAMAGSSTQRNTENVAHESAPRPPDRDRARFAEVYREHFGFVWRSLKHLGVPPQLIDDAVQELWLAVHRKLPQFEGRCRITTWLFAIALNIARNQRRRSRESSRVVRLPDQAPCPGPDPERVLLAEDAWIQVQMFMDTLDDLPRAIFVSALLENLTPAETAEAIGIDVEVVYRRVRALRRGVERQLRRSEEGSK